MTVSSHLDENVTDRWIESSNDLSPNFEAFRRRVQEMCRCDLQDTFGFIRFVYLK